MKIIISGGGTGGHIFTGIAIAEELKKKDRENQVIFVGTPNGMEVKIVPLYGYTLMTLPGKKFKGKSIIYKLSSLYEIPKGIIKGIRILKKYRPDLVLGIGGYASAPMVIAAFFSGIKTAIHEQNTIPGLTNRFLAPFVKKIFIGFYQAASFFSQRKTLITGNPVRSALLPENCVQDTKKFTILMLGGSQGAHNINTAMLDALKELMEVKDKIRIIHQSGEHDRIIMEKAYKNAGIEAKVEAFIEDMATVLKRSNLIISRAGAGSISEIMVWGKASILIPFPFAAYNHQEHNARVLSENGAAEVLLEKELTGKRLGTIIKKFFLNPEKLNVMGKNAKKLSNPHAARVIVDECYRLAGNESIN
ncbi:MAG: undecaprenyldiphospho-muramoylpentapeptide beta-N-acetylglucosaminyltransferase [Thermodesulfobacteriota bacterium]|nr:undecaprenyldiphospho-muramoylpentapeptide beta-N-acetylglucosaminyltransferase [Thermodesulfobacteriota bacterium]